MVDDGRLLPAAVVELAIENGGLGGPPADRLAGSRCRLRQSRADCAICLSVWQAPGAKPSMEPQTSAASSGQ